MKSEGVSPPLHQMEIKNLHFTDFHSIEFPVSNPDGVTKTKKPSYYRGLF